MLPVERLPIVVASGLKGDPGLEIPMVGVRVIVPVILAVIPSVPCLPLAALGRLPLVVDMDVVPLVAVERLRFVIRIPLITPIIGLRCAWELGAIWVAVLVVRSGVVVSGVLIPLTRSRLPGQDRRSHEHHCRQNCQKQHQPSQLFLLPRKYLLFPDG